MADPPVRVAHIITRMIVGGAQQDVLHLCDALRRRPGWDAVLITGPPLGPEGELLSEVRRRGLAHYVLPQLRRQVNPWRDVAALAALVRAVRRVRPTIAHTSSSKAGILGRLAARVAHVPVVVHSIWGLPFHPCASPSVNAAFIAAERIAGAVTDHFCCVSRAMATGFLKAGIGHPGQFTVVRSGIDVDAYLAASARREATRRRLGFAPDDVVIGKVARLFPLKGHRFLIDAAPQIVQRCPTARFLLVGEGVLRHELVQRAARQGVRERVTFTGLVPPQDVPALISAMDVLVHASLREGLARVLVEALLCERPVVTYDMDGAPEVILDGVTGRLVPPESVEELADAVIWAVHHADEAQAMAREGRRRFADEFRLETALRRTERVYRTLLTRHGLQPPPLTSRPAR